MLSEIKLGYFLNISLFLNKSVDKYFLLSSANIVATGLFVFSFNKIAPKKFAPEEIPTPIP